MTGIETSPDYIHQKTFCLWFNSFVHSGMAKLGVIIFSNEAWAHLDAYINAQNSHLWGSENPHAYVETDLHPQNLRHNALYHVCELLDFSSSQKP